MPIAVHDESVGRPDLGVRAILIYKTIKGAAALATGVTLLALDVAHRARSIQEAAGWIRHHVTASWSVALADVLVNAATTRGIALAGVALLFDGALTSLEGWALHRKHWWGPWLVVVTTSALLPFELYEIARRVSLLRVLALVVNIAIVVYLSRRARREARPRHA